MAIDISPQERAPLLRSASPTSSITTTKSSGSPSQTRQVGEDGQEWGISRSRGALVVASIGLLIFIQASNLSILTTTQSSIAADLDAFEKATWLTSSYLIAMSSLAPLMGKFSQLFSPRLCMFFAALVVCIGTVITAASTSFEMFIVGRAITGVGAGGTFIVATIIVIQMASHKNRGLYIGLMNTGMTAGVSLGAVIAGALEPLIGWKLLFGIQAPLALLSAFGLVLGIPSDFSTKPEETDGPSLRQRLSDIDYSGAVLLTTTIVLFLLGLSGQRVLPTPLILSGFSLSVFVLNEIYIARDPVIPISVLRSRGTLLTCLATVGFMMARWTVLFYTPAYAMAVRGWPPAKAGSILIPTNAGFASGGLLAGIFHIRRSGSFYFSCLISMALSPISFLVLSLVSTPNSPWTGYVCIVFVNGLITGASLNYTLVHLLHLTDPVVHPITLSLLATFRGFAASFGSAIGGGIFERVLRRSLIAGFKESGLGNHKELIRKLVGSPALVDKLHGKKREIAVDAYMTAIKTLFLAAMGLGILVLIVQAGTGREEAPGHKVPSPEEELDEEADGDEALLGSA